MLGVHGYYVVITSEGVHPFSPRDQRLFVGEGEAISRLQCCHGGGEAGEPNYAVEDYVRWGFGQVASRARAGDGFGLRVSECGGFAVFQSDVVGVEFVGLLLEQIRVRAG